MNLRTLLILGRVSNLPTVWSNLLVGSVFGHTEYRLSVLFTILIGGSYLYVGGMYLNDYCDAAFDAQYCPERPIPSGAISRAAVGWFAALWFLFGLGFLATQGLAVAPSALLLILAIILYDFHHKSVWWAPLLMGFCRFLLYPLAASASANLDIWPSPVSWSEVGLDAGALGLYVAGITYLARGESRPEKPTRWALLLLSVPLVLPFVVRSPNLLTPQVLGPIFLLFAWMTWILIPFWQRRQRSIGRVVSGLLAGIVLVDMIAVAPHLGYQSLWFVFLFAFALLLQRIIPAT